MWLTTDGGIAASIRLFRNTQEEKSTVENIKWLWSIMDKKYRKWHILALCISAITSIGLLINPTLSKQLVDDVIVAQNPEPLLGILFTMLAVKIIH